MHAHMDKCNISAVQRQALQTHQQQLQWCQAGYAKFVWKKIRNKHSRLLLLVRCENFAFFVSPKYASHVTLI